MLGSLVVSQVARELSTSVVEEKSFKPVELLCGEVRNQDFTPDATGHRHSPYLATYKYPASSYNLQQGDLTRWQVIVIAVGMKSLGRTKGRRNVEDTFALHLHALVMQYQELMINLSCLVRTGEIACMKTDESSESGIMVNGRTTLLMGYFYRHWGDDTEGMYMELRLWHDSARTRQSVLV